MSELLSLLDAIIDVGDIYARYGIKGCLFFILVVVGIVGGIIFLAMQFG